MGLVYFRNTKKQMTKNKSLSSAHATDIGGNSLIAGADNAVAEADNPREATNADETGRRPEVRRYRIWKVVQVNAWDNPA